MPLFIPSALETFRRKVTRSLAQRGVWHTAQRCIHKPWEILRRTARTSLPRERRHRAEELQFDRDFNVDTRADWDAGWMAQIASPNWQHGIGYAPVPVHDVEQILGGLGIAFEQYSFIDLGAGKGRAVLIAAQFPFKSVIGVEYAPALAEAMAANLGSYQNPRRSCGDMQAKLQDAAEYALPADSLVLFFHHPFEAPVFERVVTNIERSQAEHPRHVLIVYYDPKCEAVFAGNANFRLLQRGLSNRRCAASGDWVVYESTAAPR